MIEVSPSLVKDFEFKFWECNYLVGELYFPYDPI